MILSFTLFWVNWIFFLSNVTESIYLDSPREHSQKWLHDLGDWSHLTPEQFTPGKNPFDMSGCKYFPKIFHLGVQKAATSSFGGMINHCANHCYKSKELHIFEKTVLRDSISSEYLCREYKNRWVDGKSSQEGDPNRCLSIEITPDLIVYRSAAESILQSNSSAFLVLRDPVDRLISEYNMIADRSGWCELSAYKNDHKKRSERVTKDLMIAYKQIINGDLKFERRYRKRRLVTSNANSDYIMHNNMIARSMYDTLLYQHIEPLHILFFEDVVTCSPSFFNELKDIYAKGAYKMGPDYWDCMATSCKTIHSNTHPVCATRSDVPKVVETFLTKHNTFYFEELEKRKRVKRAAK